MLMVIRPQLKLMGGFQTTNKNQWVVFRFLFKIVVILRVSVKTDHIEEKVHINVCVNIIISLIPDIKKL